MFNDPCIKVHLVVCVISSRNMSFRMHRALVALLILLVITLSVAITISVSCNKLVEAFPSEGVDIAYVKIQSMSIGSIKPKIIIRCSNCKRFIGVIINAFIAAPNANVLSLGNFGGLGNEIVIPERIIEYIRSHVIPLWYRELGGLKGIKVALLVLIDVVVPRSSRVFEVYSFVKTVPTNLWLLKNGYTIGSISITVDTSRVKPIEIIDLNKVRAIAKASKCESTSRKQLSNIIKLANTEIDNGCIPLFCGIVSCPCYCSKWVLEKEYAHIKNHLIPVVMARWVKGYVQAIYTAHLSFTFNDTKINSFRIYAAIKIAGFSGIAMHEWKSISGLYFDYGKIFHNVRWDPHARTTFKDDAIVAIGFNGSAMLGEFRKYEAYCFCGLISDRCSDSDYYPTDTTANITIMDIKLRKGSDGYWRGYYSKSIDDIIGDGKGLESLWKLMMEHSKVIGYKEGINEVRKSISGTKIDLIDVGISIRDIVLWIVSKGELRVPSWAKEFPSDVGIDCVQGDIVTSHIEIQADTAKPSSANTNYDLYLVYYGSKDKVYIGNKEISLKFACFDLTIHPS